ncbi:MAG: BMP family ABC transporter substrate-binding protein [Acidobacteria bacterium]|nr:BMP family ABC transporter substrate-binding protein [Acidobacteriota bacterium]
MIKRPHLTSILFLAACLALLSGCARKDPGNAAGKPGEFVFGMLLVGPCNDKGWSEGFHAAGKYVESRLPGTRMLYVDKVNPADRPGITTSQLAEELVAKGAKFIVFNSDDMKDEALLFARRHPEIPVLHASGDTAWKEGKNYRDIPSLANFMPRIEAVKMMAGFAAALASRTGKIGYLGPLINDETRRLAVAAYLGARHAWTKVLGRDPRDLKFKVNWIGFWFFKPGETEDPTQVSEHFFKEGYDVVITGLDTTENLVTAARKSMPENPCRAFTYGYENAGAEAPDVCLGSIYMNWGPEILRQVQAIRGNRWKAGWVWQAPDYNDLNNPDTSPVGLKRGPALSADVGAKLDAFTRELAGGLNLWTGPLRFQDGSVFLGEGQTATDLQVWYLPLLLEGMEGQSVPGK